MNGKATQTNKRAGPKIRFGLVAALVIGAFVIVSGSLFAYSRQQDGQRQELETDSARLAEAMRTTGPPAAVSVGTKQAQERLEKAASLFPAGIATSAALDSILKVASASDVQVTGLQEKMAIRQVIGEHVYYAWPFHLKAEGPQTNLLNLAARLEAMEAGPLILQKAVLQKGKNGYAAALDIAFYTRSRMESAPTPTPKPTSQKTDKGKDSPAQK
ncbi:MAG: hypothetical protein HY671_04800 [Chloroflexi bacterium]|nr:hypothetical protein [Chloroflexota bacterium]